MSRSNIIVKQMCFFFSQVFLVQVNPGETFTIRAEDGTLQCIQGKRVLGHAGEHLTMLQNTYAQNLML